MYHANKRVGAAANRSRGMVVGSTRKIYRQKGTGRARMGANRTPVRKGGGVTFAKAPRDYSKKMPKKQRRLARNCAVLAKLKAQNALVIDQLSFNEPKTKEFVAILNNLKIDRSCLVTLGKNDENVYKSLRNIPKINALVVEQLNAGDICRNQKLLFTKEAIQMLMENAKTKEAADQQA